jgi:ubiquinol-cytochrome c reductase iron-sulfur subunit
MSRQVTDDRAESQFNPDDPELTRFDLVREGARRDGVEIVHYAARFPTPGSKRERRTERTIALFFAISGLASLAFVGIYIWWPWGYQPGHNQAKWFTPLLGLTLGFALLLIGFAVIAFAKKLLPEEIAVQSRHDQDVDLTERKLTGAAITNMGAELGMARRPLLKFAIPLGLAPIGLAAAAPLIGSLIKDPHHPDAYFTTGFSPANNGGNPVALVREDMTPIRPEDVSTGGQLTVFPGIPGGATNEYADSPTLLIHLRPDDAEKLRANLANVPANEGSMWGDFVAYSKICTHAGCPASLYEQQTNRLLCPCHQSQFNILDNARPIFGPATRRLPMLPITVENGHFVAKSDYKSPIGPGFWERP